MRLIYLSCAWVAGIYLGSRLDPPSGLILGGIVPSLAFILLWRRKRGVLLAGLCLLAFLGAILRFQSTVPTVDEHSLQFYNNRGTVEIVGLVDADPEPRDIAAHLRFAAKEIRIDGEWTEVSGAILVRVPRFPSYHYGDRLRVRGKLEAPPQLEEFDYRDYLARRGIYSTMLYPEVELLDEGKGFEALEWVYSLRNRLSKSLASALPEPQGSVAQGILLGARSNIPASLEEDFSRTGTAHLLAVSGLHIGIVAGLTLSLGARAFGRQRNLYILVALGAIWLYALLTGMHPSALRAAIMGTLFLYAVYLGRPRTAATSLAFAAAVMVGVQPQILWDVAFQLSFLAMAGIISLTPLLQGLGRGAVARRIGERRGITTTANIVADSFAVSLGAVLFTWPVIAYNFHLISWVSLPATLLALPAVPGIILTGAAAGALGLLSSPLAEVLAGLPWLFISYLIKVVEAFAALPFSSSQVGTIPGWAVGGYYAVLAAAIWLAGSRGRPGRLLAKLSASRARLRPGSIAGFISRVPQRWIILPLLLAAILVWSAALDSPSARLHVSFLDVGEGDAILIQTASHQNILVDGGPSPLAISLELGEELPFWDRSIDLMVLTHPHADHITGLIEVLQRSRVKQVLGPDLPYSSAVYDEWLRLLEEKGIEYTRARAGQRINLGKGTTLEVLHPQPELLGDADIDDNGIVLRLVKGKVSFLLTADIGEEAERELLGQRARLRSTVLKVAHHGSDTSTSAEFLIAVDPRVAVISVGAENPFGHPTPEVMSRLERRLGEEIYLTSEGGTVELITDGDRLWVEAGR